MSPRIVSRESLSRQVPWKLASGLLGRLEREVAAVAGRWGFDTDRVMRCEEYSEPGRLVVRAELPGLDPDEDVEVTVVGTMLRIRACRRDERPGGRAPDRRSEFFYGEMVRTLALPPGADTQGVTASYADGVLEVDVPVDGGRPALPVPVERGAR
jgi:HSP20 family protein